MVRVGTVNFGAEHRSRSSTDQQQYRRHKFCINMHHLSIPGTRLVDVAPYCCSWLLCNNLSNKLEGQNKSLVDIDFCFCDWHN